MVMGLTGLVNGGGFPVAAFPADNGPPGPGRGTTRVARHGAPPVSRRQYRYEPVRQSRRAVRCGKVNRYGKMSRKRATESLSFMTERNWLRELLEAALIGALVFIAVQASVVNFRVEGSSMQPTLDPGHYLMVNRALYFRLDTGRLGQIIPFWQPAAPAELYLARPPRRGDVVVFDYPVDTQRQFVKRIIGAPGDTVAISGGQVIVNGARLREPYRKIPGHTNMHQVRLGADEYFVLGDNRPGSRDSRHWGVVPSDLIIGKVWAIYWPRSAWGFPD